MSLVSSERSLERGTNMRYESDHRVEDIIMPRVIDKAFGQNIPRPLVSQSGEGDST